MIPRP
jgi:hypothetical protein